MSKAVDLRALTRHEQNDALALWQTVFETPSGFFERYFNPEADPQYQVGDTLGAWADGRLVSAVHVCRRPVHWDGGIVLCGGIANVATLPEFRRQGLSRGLLQMMIAKMENEGFGFSLLGTGVHSHYAALGWEQALPPLLTIHPLSPMDEDDADWQALEAIQPLVALYSAAPRPGQFLREFPYFQNWVGWSWRQEMPLCYSSGDRGYLLLVEPNDNESSVLVREWRAGDASTEQDLLRAASTHAARAGRTLLLPAMPQHQSKGFFDTLGPVVIQEDTGIMIRNIGMAEDTYRQVADAYRSGSAVRWSGDAF